MLGWILGQDDDYIQEAATKHGELDMPAQLGMGLFTLSGQAGAYPVSRDRVRFDQIFRSDVVFGFSSTRRSMLEKLRVSANASFKAFSGSASISVDFARSMQQSSSNFYVTASKYVLTRRYSLVRPELTAAARAYWRRHGDKALIARYGDSFVNAVDVGGFLHLVFSVETASEEEAQSLAVSWGAKFGSFRTSGSVLHNLTKEFESVRVQIAAQSAGSEKLVPTKAPSEGNNYIETLVDYFDNFEETLSELDGVKGSGGVIGMSTASLARACAFPISEADVEDRRIALQEAAALKDDVDARLADITMGLPAAAQIGRQSEALRVRDALLTQQDRLEEFARQAMNLACSLPQVPSEQTTESVPDEFLPTRWRTVHTVLADSAQPTKVVVQVPSSLEVGLFSIEVSGKVTSAHQGTVVLTAFSGQSWWSGDERSIEIDQAGDSTFTLMFFAYLPEKVTGAAFFVELITDGIPIPIHVRLKAPPSGIRRQAPRQELIPDPQTPPKDTRRHKGARKEKGIAVLEAEG